MKTTISGILAIALLGVVDPADASDLESTLEQRLSGDRSGACVAVARIGETTESAFYCADPDARVRLDEYSRFEIGSITKAIQGVLLARLVEQERLALDEPLVDLLPEGTHVPMHGDEPIRLIDLVTHSSGLPRLPLSLLEAGYDPDNPYVDITTEQLLDALAGVELSGPPGEAIAYSNFGAMLVSVAIVHRTGTDLGVLFDEELFGPLGMTRTSLSGPTVQGHDARGNPVSNWDFTDNLAGVGGLRSTLPDMITWTAAIQGRHDGPLASTFARARQVIRRVGDEHVGWGWFHVPVGDRRVLWHNGGTGGFSSSLAFDPNSDVGAVVLSDTSLVAHGGLDDLALHLVDEQVPLRSPRVPTASPEDLSLDDYVGVFDLMDGDEPFMGGFELRFYVDADTLMVEASTPELTQPPVALDFEADERFVQPALQLEIEFLRDDDGEVTSLDFQQAGLSLHGVRR